MKQIEKMIRSELRSLGNSREQIRKSLYARKIKGHPGVGDSCPLANFLNKNLKSKVKQILVNYSNVSKKAKIRFEVGSNLDVQYKEPEGYWNDALSFRINKDCIEFIENFDNSKYPELVKKS